MTKALYRFNKQCLCVGTSMPFGRIKKTPAEDYTKYILGPRLEDSKVQFEIQLLIHKAHVVMLAEQGILTTDEATEILTAISLLENEGVDGLNLDCHRDLYMATEAYVVEQIGEVGGKMHIGRSRNDLAAASTRMFIREKINSIIEDIIELRKAFLELAKSHVDTVMPGYTHWQQAQPVTLGHYLVAHVHALERDTVRLENTYKNVNLNPLGAGALATTGFPINRYRTMELLGFNGLIENSYDAVASRDYMAEMAAALAILMSNESRLVEDLLIWLTNEFSVIELSEEYAGTSSIMPQKKNPASLELTRAYAAHGIGELTAILCMLKGIPYSHVTDWSQASTALRYAIDLSTAVLRVMKGVISTLTINRQLMLERATEGFSTMTELADVLVRDKGLSFRTAHEIIAHVVMEALNEGKDAREITRKMIDRAAIQVIGKELKLTKETIRKALDPVENVKIRSVTGGPASGEVERMIKNSRDQVKKDERRLAERRMKIESAYQRLRAYSFPPKGR